MRKLGSASSLVKLAFSGLLLCALSGISHAQGYPDKPIKIVMPWSDGFPANSTRLYTNRLAERYKQPIVVEVRAGAGGEVAGRQVVNAPKDGYTLLATGSSITIRGVVDSKNVDPDKELQPIAQLVTTPYVIVAKAGKYGNFKTFLANAQAAQGKINFASAGVGTGMHFLGELINNSAKIKMVHIPYASGARQLQAVIAGDVEVAIISLVTAWPQIKAGVLEALVVSSTNRSKTLPNVPSLVESGLKDIPAMGAWIALFGPKNLDPAVVKSLSEQIRAIGNDPAVIETAHSWGAEIPDTRLSYLEEVISTEKKSWARLVEQNNLSTGK
ncbi:Bug family tripartite tricarboxylate transporter substrate binding protein [Lacisediminimonas profundi]|uniref:Bug family tripartite tricarboxylate transporter substrate binding protein n=1 Tax=Lacisediminimonas profundi TaxID=2603856 RepID=UPI00124B394D|nr:tripartite tricarboxylate transporter substrate binding protein [Lacisediminimonas profundi]